MNSLCIHVAHMKATTFGNQNLALCDEQRSWLAGDGPDPRPFRANRRHRWHAPALSTRMRCSRASLVDKSRRCRGNCYCSGSTTLTRACRGARVRRPAGSRAASQSQYRNIRVFRCGSRRMLRHHQRARYGLIQQRRRTISRNSRPARSGSASSTVRSCRRCSGRRRSRAGRNSTGCHHTRNNGGSGRYTRGAGRGVRCAAPWGPDRTVEDCCSAADDNPAGNRSHANSTPAAYGPAQRVLRPTAATERQQQIDTRGATSGHHKQSAVRRPLKFEQNSRCTAPR
jgi:hypothetical protein